MKNYIKYMIFAGVLFTTYSCNKDELDSESIFDTTSPERNEFDKWIYDSLTVPYNIVLDYYYKDNESDISENVIPAKVSQSIALAKLMKHVWIDAYSEVAGKEFLKKNCFRHFFFVGSGEYSNGSIKLGQAEGGLKVTLLRVNEFNINNIYVNNEDFYRQHNQAPMDMNFWYFHTMHHEFCHILTQTKEYSTAFRQISERQYKGSDWVNTYDEEAAADGFVTGYATKEFNEDFAETYAVYVTSSDATWNQILEKATKQLVDTNGAPIYKLDKYNKPIIQTDAKGNPIYELKNGWLVPETDANGNVVYATDNNGNPIYMTDAEGNKIPAYNEQLQNKLVYTISNNEIIGGFNYEGETYRLETTAPFFTPAVETLFGDTIYNAEGKTIQKYFRMPVFKYKYVQMTDDMARNNILKKLDIVRAYFKEQWNVDIDKLRNKIQEKTSKESLKSLNLKTVKD